MMKITATKLPNVYLIEPKRHGDQRGFFAETYRYDLLAEQGIKIAFQQDNHAYSEQAGVLRGLHYQLPPYAQDKLIRVVRGAIYDVAVDIRKSSPSFGQWVGVELSANNWRQLLVPQGFAHGYLTLEQNTEVVYKVSNGYQPAAEAGIIWSDPNLNITWPNLVTDYILSSKDQQLPTLAVSQQLFT